MLSKIIGNKTTLGREVALIAIFMLIYSIYKGDAEVVKAIVWPTYTYIAAVVGIRLYGDKST